MKKLRAFLIPVIIVAGSTCLNAQEGPLRGYSIPIIDLADDESRRVIVDREEGQYLGHVTTVLLDDGKTIIAVYPKGHGRGQIVMKKSYDGGLTWSDRLSVPENWSTSKEVPTIFHAGETEASQRLILFSGLYPIRMAVSEDNGDTWSGLEKIGRYGGIVAMGDMTRLKNGYYLALFHDDTRFINGEGFGITMGDNLFTVYGVISKDGGLTWSKPKNIVSKPDVHLCEPGFVRSPDGNQLSILLRENSRTKNAHVIFSDDEGLNWTDPVQLPGALTGDRHTARYSKDGRLVITFRDTTLDSPTSGDWVVWVGTYDDISNGREGQYRVRLMDNTGGADCCYPGMQVLPDGTFVATTYGHWDSGAEPYIVSIRFTLDEIDALANEYDPDREIVNMDRWNPGGIFKTNKKND